MPSTDSPSISVVIVTPDVYATIAKTMFHLRQQTVREQMELIVVAPSRQKLAMPNGALEGFGAVQVIETGRECSISRLRAAGAQAATAPFVAFSEDHCFPEPDWAERMVTAMTGPYVAVGPRFHNANPRTALSWANYLHNFGTWGEPKMDGVAPMLPWHNTTYKREILQGYGSRLSQMLEVEGVLQEEIKAGGGKLYLEGAAQVHHLNMSRLSTFCCELFNSGRLFGSTRSQDWSFFKRLLFFLASPLIPLSRLRGLFRHLRRHRTARVVPASARGIGPALILGCTLHVMGEAIGFVLGVGNARQRKSQFETHRVRYLCRRDREALLASPDQLDIP